VKHSRELLEACAGIPRPGGPAHFVRLFQPGFARLVERGEKRQTIRPIPKRIPRVGDTISLRTWTGKPRRSKQRVLREARITKVRVCCIGVAALCKLFLGARAIKDSATTVAWSGWVVPLRDTDYFAKADGFKDWYEMQEWFSKEHGLPFEGIAIWWE
jgi:hypothetical protein